MKIKKRPNKILTKTTLLVKRQTNTIIRIQTMTLTQASRFSPKSSHIIKTKLHSTQILKTLTMITTTLPAPTTLRIITAPPTTTINRHKTLNTLTTPRRVAGTNTKTPTNTRNRTNRFRSRPKHVPRTSLTRPRVLPNQTIRFNPEHSRRTNTIRSSFRESKRRRWRIRVFEIEPVEIRNIHLWNIAKFLAIPVTGGPIRNGAVVNKLELTVVRWIQPQRIKSISRVC
ncbi:hypothetical protein KIW84_045304 [Lathyrus oleraceus]|uniref:Uncharacterized protein n=1 Tax=Pisum sativum TaxID=3888 RepID=A0A9D4XI89_PEA|nr:hypothetical protein KIW84_045304 [Pisum sativum]